MQFLFQYAEFRTQNPKELSAHSLLFSANTHIISLWEKTVHKQGPIHSTLNCAV